MEAKNIRKPLIFFLVALLLFPHISIGSPAEIRKILSLPENQIDLGYTFLLLSKDAYPEFDIKEGMGILNSMAGRMEQFLTMINGDPNKPEDRIGTLNTFLFREGPWNNAGNGRFIKYEYDLASTEVMQPKALFLVNALTTLKGTCSSLPMLWYAVADKLGWPIQAVRMPGHIFLRYTGMKTINIDPSSYGGSISNAQYIEDFKISETAIKNGSYMKSLSKKEFISTLLVNNAFYCISEHMDTASAVEYLEISIEADSTNVDAIANLAKIKMDNDLLKVAIRKGFSRGYSENFIKKQKESIDKQKRGISP